MAPGPLETGVGLREISPSRLVAARGGRTVGPGRSSLGRVGRGGRGRAEVLRTPARREQTAAVAGARLAWLEAGHPSPRCSRKPMVPWSHSLQCSQPLGVKAYIGTAAASGRGYGPPPLISPRRHPGHPDRSAVGSRLSQGGEGPPRVPGIPSRLDGRVIRRSKLGAGRSDSER